MKGSVLNLSLILVLLLNICSCSRSDKKSSAKWQDTVTTGVIPISCDQCFQPIIQAEIDVFESLYPIAGIVPIYTDEVEAIQLLLEDSVSLAVTARPLTEGEKAIITNKKMVVRDFKIAVDAIALIVNKENSESIIGVPNIKKILTGEITEWKQLNPRSKLGKIEVMFDNPNSSTVRYAIDSICRGEELSKNLYAQKSNKEVIEMVAKVPGALGIIGANWINNDNDSTNLSFNEKIKVLSVGRYANPDRYNSFEPYQAHIALGNYPMTRNVYILLSDPKTGLSTGFTSFVTSDRGQRIILKSGILPAASGASIRIVNVNDKYPY